MEANNMSIMNEQKGIVRDEFGKLVDVIATSLGCMVFAVAVAIGIVFVMKEIYCCPPEEGGGEFPNGMQSRRNIAVPLTTDPTYRWHPSNIYHHR